MIENLPEYQPPIRIDGEVKDPFERFNEHERNLLEGYPGEWIAIAEDGWFAHSESAEKLSQLIEDGGREDVFICGMPTPDTPARFYGNTILNQGLL